jgi:hypothetical protein
MVLKRTIVVEFRKAYLFQVQVALCVIYIAAIPTIVSTLLIHHFQLRANLEKKRLGRVIMRLVLFYYE